MDGSKKQFVKGSQAKDAIFRIDGSSDFTIITEAAVDAISSRMVGNDISAFATGSANTVDMLGDLEIDNAVLFFDNDRAGQMATQKALEVLPGAKVVDWSAGEAIKLLNWRWSIAFWTDTGRTLSTAASILDQPGSQLTIGQTPTFQTR